MFPMLVRTERSFLMGSALVLGALVGWIGFAYSALSAGRTVDAITGERDAALAQLQQVQETFGKLSEMEAKLGSARVEYSRVVQGWADTRGKLGTAQQELAALAKRLDLATERVSQTR